MGGGGRAPRTGIALRAARSGGPTGCRNRPTRRCVRTAADGRRGAARTVDLKHGVFNVIGIGRKGRGLGVGVDASVMLVRTLPRQRAVVRRPARGQRSSVGSAAHAHHPARGDGWLGRTNFVFVLPCSYWQFMGLSCKSMFSIGGSCKLAFSGASSCISMFSVCGSCKLAFSGAGWATSCAAQPIPAIERRRCCSRCSCLPPSNMGVCAHCRPAAPGPHQHSTHVLEAIGGRRAKCGRVEDALVG